MYSSYSAMYCVGGM